MSGTAPDYPPAGARAGAGRGPAEAEALAAAGAKHSTSGPSGSETRPGEPTDADLKLRRNERMKLAAAYLNTLAAACVAVGGLTPLAGLVLRPDPSNADVAVVVALALAAVAASVLLHWLAHRVLGGLKA